MEKPKVAIVRGKFLNRYEMQTYENLINKFYITGFSSLTPIHDDFKFPIVKLLSPMDLPNFPYKMQILNRIFIDAHYLFGLEEKLKEFDIAHTAETYFHYTQQCLNAKKKGYVKKVVVTVWENISFTNEGIRGRKGFKRRAIEEVDHFIAISQKAKNALLKEGADAKKITIVNPGIDVDFFRVKNRNFESKKINILFVGRLEYCKGIYDFISAISILVRKNNLKKYLLYFTFVGDGIEKKKILEEEKRIGVDGFISHKTVSYENIIKEYKNADIFVAPSKDTDTWQEQYNMALLEAQSCGLPIIATKAGSIPENVGDAAILVNQGDASALAIEIEKMILDPNIRVEYSKRARKRAEEFHDAKIKAEEIAKVYNRVL